MVPIDEDKILFLNEPDPPLGYRKGVTVTRIETFKNPGGEIRICIWTFCKLAGGYITPKKGGISLTVDEYETLIEKSSWATRKIELLHTENLTSLIDKIHKVEDLEEIQKQVQAAKQALETTVSLSLNDTGKPHTCASASESRDTSKSRKRAHNK